MAGMGFDSKHDFAFLIILSDDTILMAENEEEIKSLVMKVKVESEKVA